MTICSSWALLRAVTVAAFISVSTLSSLAVQAADDDVEYRYDDLGRLVEIIYWDQDKTHRYTYDDAGNRSETIIVDGTPNIVRLWKASAVEGQDLRFGVWRKHDSQLSTTVNYETVACGGSDDATAGEDFQATNGSVTITRDNLVGKGAYIPIQTFPDTLTEGEEKVCVTLTSVIGGVIDEEARTREGRIIDADNENISYSLSRPNVKEGNRALVTITKTGSHSARHTVVVRTQNGTALAGHDFQPFERELVFWPKMEKQVIQIQTLEDDDYEGRENFYITLSEPGDPETAEVLATSLGSIFENAPVPLIRVGQGGVREGDDQVETWHEIGHGIWVSPGFVRPIRGDWVVCVKDSTHPECEGEEGLTAEMADFDEGTAFSGSFLFTAENPETVVTMPVFSDTVAEDDEQYLLKVYNLKNAQLDSERGRAYGNIRNDDGDVSVYNNFGAPAVDAGQPLEFTVRRWADLSGAKTLNFTVLDGNFSRPNDPLGYQHDRLIADAADLGLTSGTFSFPNGGSGNTPQTATFEIPTVAIDPSTPYEGSKTVPVTISLQAGDTGHITVPTRSGTIRDPNIPVVTVTGASAYENTGSLDFTFELSRAAAFDIEVKYATTLEGTATLDDFNHAVGTVTFPAGSTTPQTATVTIRDDNDSHASEGAETVVMALGVNDVLLAADTAVGTILNDPNDACNSHMFVDSGEQTWESDGGQVITVNLRTGTCPEQYVMHDGGSSFAAMAMQGVTATEHTYELELVAGSAEAGEDFEAQSVTLNLSALNDEQQIPMEVFDDLINEIDEDLTVRATPTAAGDIADEDTALVILDDDPGALFSVSDVTQSEGSSFTFTVTKTGEADRSSTLVYQTQDGTALAGEDYLPVSGTLSFEPTETMKTVVVQSLGNSEFEYDEKFTFVISDATGAGAIEAGEAVGLILDDDPAPTFGISDVTGTEGEDLMVTVHLDRPSPFEHRVTLLTLAGSARDGDDYLPVGGTLTFAPGDTVVQVAVNTVDDGVIEPTESFEVQLQDPTGGALVGDQTAVLSILDNERSQSGGTLYGPNHSSDEVINIAAGNQVTLTLAGGAGGGSTSNSIAGLGGKGSFTFIATKDFQSRARIARKGLGGVESNIGLNDITGATPSDRGNAGQGGGASAIVMSTDGVTWVPVAVVGGGGGGGISSTLGGHGGGLGQDGVTRDTYERTGLSATTTQAGAGGIWSSRPGGVGGAPGADGEAAVGEGNIAGSGDPEFAIGGGGSGNYKNAGGGGGGYYGGGGGTNDYAAGGGSGFFDAASIEAITGGVPTIQGNMAGGNDGDGYLTVAIDAVDAPEVTLEVSDASIEEGGDLVVTLVASGDGSGDVVLDYATADGTATAGVDYEAASGTVTFAPGDVVKSIRIATFEDLDQEADEDFTVTLSLVSGIAELPNPSMTAKILDDDEAPGFAVGETEVSVTEGVQLAFNVIKDQLSENTYTIDYEIVAGTAVSGEDYVPVSGTLTFGPDDMLHTVYVDTIDDEVSGDGGTLTFRLSNASGGAVISTTDATGTILDNDMQFYTETFTSDTVWVAPAGVTELVTVKGLGAAGTPSKIVDSSRTVTYWSSDSGIAYSTANSHAQSQFDKLAALSTSSFSNITSSVKSFKSDGSTVTWTLSGSVRRKSSGPTKTGTGWSAGSGATGTYKWTIGGLQSKTAEKTGASTTGFDMSFPGGAGGPATEATYTNVPVTAGESYSLDIATDGYITIEYWAPGTGGSQPPVLSDPVSISVSDATVEEGGLLLFTVTAEGMSSEALTIDVTATDGSATGGQDYEQPGASFVLDPGVTQKTVAIQTLDDETAEGHETFTLTLSSSSSLVSFADADAVGTIQDNDALPVTMSSSGAALRDKVTLSNNGYTARVMGRSEAVGSTHRIVSGKAYYEVTVDTKGSAGALLLSLGTVSGDSYDTGSTTHAHIPSTGVALYYNTYGLRRGNGPSGGTTVLKSSTPDVNAGDTIGVYLNADDGKIGFSVRGGTVLWFSEPLRSGYRAWTPMNASGDSSGPSVTSYNFGEQPFQFTPQSGFEAFNAVAAE